MARATIDDLAVTSDIIVGFPGETDDDFEATLEVAAEVGYDSCYPFIFSPRTGTEAATMTDRFVRRGRHRRSLRAAAGRARALARWQRHEARVGRVESVLVEGPSKRDDTRWSGRTTQNKLVHFERADGVAAGGYADVRVTHGGAAPPARRASSR